MECLIGLKRAPEQLDSSAQTADEGTMRGHENGGKDDEGRGEIHNELTRILPTESCQEKSGHAGHSGRHRAVDRHSTVLVGKERSQAIREVLEPSIQGGNLQSFRGEEPEAKQRRECTTTISVWLALRQTLSYIRDAPRSPHLKVIS